MREGVSFMDREVARVWSPSQTAAERETKRRPLFYTYLNLWPFVGVMLALLFLFIGDTTPDVQHQPPVDLPSGFHTRAQPKALAEDAIKVYVTRDGRVYFRNTQVQAKSLPALIRGAVQEGAEKKVYLEADARVKYGAAAAVVNEIGKAGIREICVLAYKREQ